MSDLTPWPEQERATPEPAVDPSPVVVPLAPNLDDMYDDERESVVEKVDRYADLVFDDEVQAPDVERRPHHVIAVMVAHEGERWLTPAIATLERLERAPDVIVAVDTGSTDSTGELLRDWLGVDSVLDLPAGTGFGEAVAAGLALAEELMASGQADPPDVGDTQWLWTLHDDCAPDAWALEDLLESSDTVLTAGILGPKILGWHDRRLLLEAGVTIAGSGRRITGLERGELDQGQHDGLRDVLSVSSAGMLVRRDVWDAIGGYDPALPLFRGDLDLCWRATEAGYRVMVATKSVLHHAEAGVHGRRDLGAVGSTARRADREAAMHVLVAHSSAWTAPFVLLRLIVGSLARGVGLLLGKVPDEAADEFAALGSLLAHPGRISASRKRVATTRQLPPSALRPLRPRLGSQVRHAGEAVIGLVTGSAGTSVSTTTGPSAGPSDDDAFSSDFDDSRGRVGFWVRRPALLLALLLVAVSLIGARAWFGSGLLAGGALLTSPPGAGDLWDTYAQGWHEVGPGAATAAPPYLMVLAFMASLLLGAAPRAVDTLLFLGIPIAAVVMYLSLRRVVGSRLVRAIAAAAYALLPAALGAVTTGRIGTIAFLILLPALVRMCLRAPMSWRAAWGGSLLLAVVVAFVPLAWPLVLAAAIAAVVWAWGVPSFAADPETPEAAEALGVLSPATAAVDTTMVVVNFRSRPVILRLLIFVGMPLLLLLPWSLDLLRNPASWLLQAGLPGPIDDDLTPWRVALLQPGGPGMPPVWVTAGILALGIGALVRRRSRPLATVAWLIVIAGLAVGVLQTLLKVRPPSETLPIHTWPGPATIVIGLGLIIAGAAAADGIGVRLARDSFSWRQPAAVLAVVGALLAPLLCGGWLMWRGVGTTVVRGDGSAVPAFVAAESLGPDRPRSLVFTPSSRGIEYALIQGEGPRLGAAETGPPSAAYDQLNALVADLMAGRGGGEIDGLGRYGVRFVVLAGASPELVEILDSEPGLRRISSAENDTLWRLDTESARVRAVASKPASTDIAAGEKDGAVSVDGPLPASMPDSSTLQMAERADSSWRATLGGTELAVSADRRDGWRQAFVLPSGTGTLRVWFDQESRHRWLWLEGVLVAVTIILALPGRRRPDDDPEADLVGLDDPVPSAARAESSAPSTAAAVVERPVIGEPSNVTVQAPPEPVAPDEGVTS